MAERLPEYGKRLSQRRTPLPPRVGIAAIHYAKEGWPLFDDLMFRFVGDPDPNARRSGGLSWLHREVVHGGVFRETVEYTEEVFTGYSEEGTLLHVRMAEGLGGIAAGYLIAVTDGFKAIDEPRILGLRHNARDTVIHFMNGEHGRRMPPMMRPDRDSQWRLEITHPGEEVQSVTLTHGRAGATQNFLPIEELHRHVHEIRETSRDLGHLTLLNTGDWPDSPEPVSMAQ